MVPQEAQRIKTPSLAKMTAMGKSRGFFFDLPESPGTEKSEDASRVETGSKIRVLDEEEVEHKAKAGEMVDVAVPKFRSPVAPISPTKETYPCWSDNDHEVSAAAFASSIVEHLPKSPLCPNNAKYVVKRPGRCPYHK